MLPDEAFGLVDTDSAWLESAWGLGDLRVASAVPLSPARQALRDLLADEVDKDPVVETSTTELASGSCKLRLRPRGAFTRSLEEEVRRSTWWSDLGGGALNPAKAWLDSYFGESGVKTSGKVKLLSWVDGERPRSTWVMSVRFSSENGTSDLWVSHELLAALTAVRVFRPISEGLLASLRSRARLWAEEISLPVVDLVRFLPGTLTLACLPMPDEVLAVGALRGSAAAWSADVLGALGVGVAKGPSRVLSSWWAVLKPALGGVIKSSPTTASCVVRMPS